jgi:hypothetical protein
MNGKRIGDPCPKCSQTLIRRAKRMVVRSGGPGDVAFCAGCNAAFEADEPQPIVSFARPLAV